MKQSLIDHGFTPAQEARFHAATTAATLAAEAITCAKHHTSPEGVQDCLQFSRRLNSEITDLVIRGQEFNEFAGYVHSSIEF